MVFTTPKQNDQVWEKHLPPYIIRHVQGDLENTPLEKYLR